MFLFGTPVTFPQISSAETGMTNTLENVACYTLIYVPRFPLSNGAYRRSLAVYIKKLDAFYLLVFF